MNIERSIFSLLQTGGVSYEVGLAPLHVFLTPYDTHLILDGNKFRKWYNVNLQTPNPYPPEGGEPKKEINHESTKGPRLNRKKSLTGQAKTRKKDKTNFVFSKFRGFVVKKFFHKMQRIHN